MKSNNRKQSIYYDVNENANMKDDLHENNDNLSDNEENAQPFRLRSGTDISDSLNNARYKIRKNLSKFPPDEIDIANMILNESSDDLEKVLKSTVSSNRVIARLEQN
jgi:hypothetical protein